MSFTVASVSEIVLEIKSMLEGEFRQISVEGEISNLSLSSSKHWYFSLTDGKSILKCALFRMDASRNPIVKRLKDGEKVLCSGGIGVYAKGGTFQLITRKISFSGKGSIKEQFEALKEKLKAEGLFDLEKKKKIPSFPKKVAIITALRGAALQDFINIYKRRGALMNLLIAPTLVQGDQAADSIRAALERIVEYSKVEDIDAVVLTRGGGSVEDLWPFNDENLARDIFNCPLPFISAVGHQVDFTISDFVADMRSETPSAAAEMITNRQFHVKESLTNTQRRSVNGIKILFSGKFTRLQKSHPRIILDKIWGQYREYRQRLDRCWPGRRGPESKELFEKQMRVDDAFERLKLFMSESLTNYKNQVQRSEELLKALNPQNIMKRGYTYLKTQRTQGSRGDKLIGSLEQFKKIRPKEKMAIFFHDGRGKVEKEGSSKE